MRILFITATRIGDAVLSTGLIDYLQRTYPDARFTIACGEVAEGVFERMPRRETTLIVRKRRADLHWLLLWARTVGTWWDLVVDLRGSALSFFLPTRRRAIMRGGRRPGHRLRHLAATLGLKAPQRPVSWINLSDQGRASELLPPQGPVLGIGPTANWAGKVWPAERFIELVQRLRTRWPGMRVAVFAGPGEAEALMAQPVLDAFPDAVNLVGRLTLPQAAACLARCTVFVGNDSGLMHLAAASRVPTLGLFGPTLASEYAPSGLQAAFVAAAGPDAQAPMSELSIDDVEAAVLTLVEPL